MDLSTDENIVLSKQFPIKYKGANTNQIDCISTWMKLGKVQSTYLIIIIKGN